MNKKMISLSFLYVLLFFLFIFLNCPDTTSKSSGGGDDDDTPPIPAPTPVLTINQVKKLISGDPDDGDYFGNSAAISGDYAIVGAYGDSEIAAGSGAAYIFKRDQGGADKWGQVKKLTESDAGASGQFGYSVSISGDYAVVGAVQNTTQRGAVYIFYKHQGGPNNWGQLKKLTASDAENYDYFGASVSIDSGYIVVGATYEDDGGSNAGAAYIYYMNQGGTYNWGEVKKITASDAFINCYFGTSVSISGSNVIVGSNASRAYIYNKNQGGTNNWGEVKIITVSDSSGSGFGNSVSLSGNYAVIGDNANDGNGTPGCLRGAVYIFNKDKGGSNNWGKVKKIIASDPADNDNFGQSVSISGDYAVVGTYSKSSNKGAVYVIFP